MNDITETKEVFCSVSRNYCGPREFRIILPELILGSEIVNSISQQIGLSPQELECLTLRIKKCLAGSLTGDKHLLEKVLKLKIRLTIEECELVDDKPRIARVSEKIV